MLDSETKRRIDTARDILVGKLPDPKSQVEQITIALIYKFMDDMDVQAVEYGGKPSFFVGDFERYGWRKLFGPNVGGHELLALYGEAITKLNQNPQLPQLFRDIFKNAFLPYRDPETLKLFLKTINEFQYDHSERLGDAFEYLLSVLGSQGDAGQFRTPRHIIDFIVEVVQPKKNETVCDPACGTAGFLISSYKHILRDNTRRALGDLLTPDERKRLMTNIVGYDISPDMVRLSLVNLYLHGFPDPHIYEYDTLTSEERWNESFDVVMANPPFMSPKGGIKPHKKFSLQANRSEVLFVDYIAEHINPVSGRAGVIVPEGIIFQSANAYKDLRKMMIAKEFLYAVVSLPAGVFNPYSGVKTSILFFDKTLAAKSDKILFVKIADDGFGLGAQRKQLKTSDLPDALNVILDFQKAILHGDTSSFENIEGLASSAVTVVKSAIAANGDFNLSGDRYRTSNIRHSYFEMVELGEVAEIGSGNAAPQDELCFENGQYNFFRTSDVGAVHISSSLTDSRDKLNEFGIKGLRLFPKNTILFPKSGASTFLNHRAMMGIDGYVSSHLATITPRENVILPNFLFNLLIKIDAKSLTNDQNYPSLKTSEIAKIKIPLPPLSVQKEIVERVEGYQRLIDGAKQVVKSFKPNINLNPDWQMVELGEVCLAMHQGINTAGDGVEFSFEGYPILQSRNMTSGVIDFENIKLMSSGDWHKYKDKYRPKTNDILLSNIGTIGRSVIVSSQIAEKEFLIHWNIFKITPDETKINPRYLKTYFEKLDSEKYFDSFQKGGTVKFVSKKILQETPIPLPPLEEQKHIVAQIEHEQSLVNANKELIEIYEQKIKDEINKLWEP